MFQIARVFHDTVGRFVLPIDISRCARSKRHADESGPVLQLGFSGRCDSAGLRPQGALRAVKTKSARKNIIEYLAFYFCIAKTQDVTAATRTCRFPATTSVPVLLLCQHD